MKVRISNGYVFKAQDPEKFVKKAADGFRSWERPVGTPVLTERQGATFKRFIEMDRLDEALKKSLVNDPIIIEF